MTSKNSRIMIFIDNSNIFNGFKKYSIKADYEKLKKIITDERELKGIFLYEGIVYPLSNEKKKWYNDLTKKSGYKIKASFDKKLIHKTIEKKIDVKMAIDIISNAYENNFDKAIIVSGDGDFIPVLKKLKKINKAFEIWAFKYSLANKMKEEVESNNLFYLDDILNDLTI